MIPNLPSFSLQLTFCVNGLGVMKMDSSPISGEKCARKQKYFWRPDTVISLRLSRAPGGPRAQVIA